MNRPKRLSATFVKTVNQPGRYGDGRGGFGLSLLVKPTSTGRLSKTWSQKIRINGEPGNIGLGAYPVVTLAEARAAALVNRRAVAQGRDPRHKVANIPTFEQAVEMVIAIHEPNWRAGARSAEIWRSSLRTYAMPRLGRKPVNKITTSDVLAVLVPIWSTKRETARRVRQRIGAIMKWSVAEGYRDDNPAGDAIGAALPKNGTHREHQRALPHAEVGATLHKVRESNAWPATKLAFEFLVLTASRSGEVRGARWDEIDGDTWTVPGDRMKAGRPHRVPLSRQALKVLDEARDLADGSGLVFPSARGKVLSDMTISKLIRELGIPAVPHGFRSSFRDWCGESGIARELAEMCLAHTVGNEVERAYARSDLFQRRHTVMEQWAAYIAESGNG